MKSGQISRSFDWRACHLTNEWFSLRGQSSQSQRARPRDPCASRGGGMRMFSARWRKRLTSRRIYSVPQICSASVDIKLQHFLEEDPPFEPFLANYSLQSNPRHVWLFEKRSPMFISHVFSLFLWRTVGKETQTVRQSFTVVTLLLDCLWEYRKSINPTITDQNECVKPSGQC